MSAQDMTPFLSERIRYAHRITQSQACIGKN